MRIAQNTVSSIESNTNQYKIIQLMHLKGSNSNTVSSQNRIPYNVKISIEYRVSSIESKYSDK